VEFSFIIWQSRPLKESSPAGQSILCGNNWGCVSVRHSISRQAENLILFIYTIFQLPSTQQPARRLYLYVPLLWLRFWLRNALAMRSSL